MKSSSYVGTLFYTKWITDVVANIIISDSK